MKKKKKRTGGARKNTKMKCTSTIRLSNDYERQGVDGRNVHQQRKKTELHKKIFDGFSFLSFSSFCFCFDC